MADFQRAIDETIEQAMKNLEKLSKILENIDASKIVANDTKSIYNISNALSGTARIVADLERASRERETLVSEAAQILKQEIRQILKARPDLIEEVQKVVGIAEERLKLTAKRGRPKKRY